MALTLKRNESNGITLLGYSDSSYGDDEATKKSTSGFLYLLYGNPITWSSKRQQIVTLSTCEAEYVALCAACCEGVWIKNLLESIGLKEAMKSPIILRGDNQGSILLADGNANHSRSKHIDIRYHKINDLVTEGVFVLEWIPTDEMIADCFTKALASPKLSFFIPKLGLERAKASK